MLTAAEIEEWDGGRPAAMPTVVEWVELTKSYDRRASFWRRARVRVAALDCVSGALHQGETLAILGPAGAGKSTLVRLLAGLEQADSGSLIVPNASANGARWRWRRKPAVVQLVPVPTRPLFHPRRTVLQSVAKAARSYGLDRRTAPAVAQECLAIAGLGPGAQLLYPQMLSDADVWRAGIAQALVLAPRVLILDHVDRLDATLPLVAVGRLIEDIRRRRDVTIVVVGRSLSPLLSSCQRIMVMHDGRIAEIGPATTVKRQPRHPLTARILDRPDELEAPQAGATAPDQVLPEPADRPPHCRYHRDCRFAEVVCSTRQPPAVRVGDGHHVACHMVSAASGHTRFGRPMPRPSASWTERY